MVNVLNESSFYQRLTKIDNAVETNHSFKLIGKVTRVLGMRIEVAGLVLPLNTLCEILVSDTKKVIAEAVAFSKDITYLLAVDSIEGIRPGTPVIPFLNERVAKVGNQFLGRVVDANGSPLDMGGDIIDPVIYPFHPTLMNPLLRQKITQPFDVGVRAINALLTIGRGQRIGIFAGSGVGKSVLLGMMTRFAESDVVVVGLVGERGREVKEFIEDILGPVGLARSIVIAAPSDTAPLQRVNAALYATSMAEYYRDQGKNVLLILDSLTRFAQAHREISLATGELPATKGYAPSVFGKISQLVERAGNGIKQTGSITAFYTVLADSDEMNDPISDHIRSVLDGHIVLSKKLAETNHYPAIDIEKSISRVMCSITDKEWQACTNAFKRIYSLYLQNEDVVHMGIYQAGSDPRLDDAILRNESFIKFLIQAMDEKQSLPNSLQELKNLMMKVSV
jgi:flagellum-specific ATP synthase